jgi:hypothetical protein
MSPSECHSCKWFYIIELKGVKEYFCTYSKNHQTNMKFGRIVDIHRIKVVIERRYNE